MRKQVTNQSGTQAKETAGETGWLNLEPIAAVEVSSEAPGSPVEGALTVGSTRGWEAASHGPASITLRFDAPQDIARTQLRCMDAEHERSQEWALQATFADRTHREVLRQGWNFSPGGSTEQNEQYVLNLRQVVALSLSIDPDRGRDRYPATLLAWRIAGPA